MFMRWLFVKLVMQKTQWFYWPLQNGTFNMHWGLFAAESEAVGMSDRTSKSEAMVLPGLG